jgi:hypothetical protein
MDSWRSIRSVKRIESCFLRRKKSKAIAKDWKEVNMKE